MNFTKINFNTFFKLDYFGTTITNYFIIVINLIKSMQYYLNIITSKPVDRFFKKININFLINHFQLNVVTVYKINIFPIRKVFNFFLNP
ncbi:hypothetical protein DBW_1512 [Desulfuromonas sp. DDH964]|nr:hypothetical protein DBW_1512 [Desulfuromonas sp. DDH964]